MRKPRMLPIIITAVLSVAVIFGGWTLYKQTAVTSPLWDAVKEVPGVAAVDKPAISQEQVTVSVKLSEGASLKEVYGSINKQGKAIAGSRTVDLTIENVDDELLNSIWHQAMFEVAEAMERKTYSNIPKAMEQVTASQDDVIAITEMDETNVYITLRSAKGAKYIVLPRTPNQLEVWPNA